MVSKKTRMFQDSQALTSLQDSTPVKILIFNRSFFPDSASTGQLLTELCEDLVKDYNYDVTVVVGATNGSKIKGHFFVKEHVNGIKVLRVSSSVLNKSSILGRISNYITYFLYAIPAAFHSDCPDLVIAFTDPPIIGLVARFFSWKHKCKFVLVCQDIFPQVAALIGRFRGQSITNFILERASRYLIRKADIVVAIGDLMKRKLVQEKDGNASKMRVIHNWADTENIYPLNGRNSFSEEYNFVDKFVVMHSGNIGLSQSLETLIETARLLKSCEEIMFVIIGEGVKKADLMRVAAEYDLSNVRFIPYQPKDRLAESFSSASVFIISLRKGLAGYIVPSKLYSILAAGKPFVAAVEDCSEVVDILKQHNCGIQVEPENPRDLAAGILSLYNNPALIRRLGENSRTASYSYDRKTQIRKYSEVIQALIDKK